MEGESCSWLGKNAQFFRNTMKFQLCKDVSHGDPVLPRQMDYERFMFDSLVYAPPKKPPPGIQHSCLATVSTPRTATRTAAVFSDAVGGRPELGASHGLGEAREVMKMADGNKDVRVSGHTTRPS